MKSYALRDESNELLDQAERLLCRALNLPPLSKLRPRYFDPSTDLRNYDAKLSRLSGRLDASYHTPVVAAILRRLKAAPAEITTIGDGRVSKRIILPGRFARVYVQQGQGAVYFTGKHILELDPSDKKYLAFSQHARKIKDELTIKHNMLLLTCSGTLGKVVLCPRHWDGWVMTHDIIRIVPSHENMVGFAWVFLTSPYGQELIKRYSYGAVVQHIEDHHIARLPIPLLKDTATHAEINRLALNASNKRTQAYHLELKAIKLVNDVVLESP
jgi:type I restriction enzyme S subunit